MCGIKRRLNYPEFEELIKEYDILCLTETKTDNLDNIVLKDFQLHIKNRHDVAFRRSGGILIAYKEKLAKSISIVETQSKFVQWFQFSGSCMNSSDNILFWCSIYSS